jgi:nucleoside-diphosphate-sugar epimerase
MRFLITGGAGFIGSHLADELLARGQRVRILGDLSTGSMDNIRHLKDDSRFGYDEAYEAGFEDMPRRPPDTSKIDTAVGWSPTRSLDEILEDVMNFHQAEAAVV